ncbi:MAG: prolyl oligopeptidase family serine peptidase, partial [Myxococcota bacterium]
PRSLRLTRLQVGRDVLDMLRIFVAVAMVGLCCAPSAWAETTLAEARRGHQTKPNKKVRASEGLPEPAPMFERVTYPTPLGPMQAYVGKPSSPERRYPAIIWITGGFPPGGMDSSAWSPQNPSNDQSAKAYREAGLIMMYPTFRGSSGNPGFQETLYGEVDDVLAAHAYLAKLDFVDPKRIYLGGHSTGGTLALLVAESTNAFKAVFSFGPVADPAVYRAEVLTYDPSDRMERRLRAPIHYLAAVRSPTFILEGTLGNHGSLLELEKASKNEALQFTGIRGADHFDILAPLNRFIAGKLATWKTATRPELPATALQAAFDSFKTAHAEADDLESIAAARRDGFRLDETVAVTYYFLSRSKPRLAAANQAAAKKKVEGQVERRVGQDETPYYILLMQRRHVLRDLPKVFATSRAMRALAVEHDVQYGGWYAQDN